MPDRSVSGPEKAALQERVAVLEQELRELRRVVAEELFELRTRIHGLAAASVVPPGRPKLAARLGIAVDAPAAKASTPPEGGPKRARRSAAGPAAGPKKAARARAQVARELDAQTRISEPPGDQPA